MHNVLIPSILWPCNKCTRLITETLKQTCYTTPNDQVSPIEMTIFKWHFLQMVRLFICLQSKCLITFIMWNENCYRRDQHLAFGQAELVRCGQEWCHTIIWIGLVYQEWSRMMSYHHLERLSQSGVVKNDVITSFGQAELVKCSQERCIHIIWTGWVG